MKKDNKQRLFEVMGRLDKTFKPKLNEGFEEELPAETGAEEIPVENGTEAPAEQTPEEKLAALTAKIDSLYAMVHGDEEGEESAEAEEEKLEGEPAQEPEGLTEWNFDKKKGEKKDEEKEEGEKEEGEKEEKKELDEAKPKIPVAAIPKVGK